VRLPQVRGQRRLKPCSEAHPRTPVSLTHDEYYETVCPHLIGFIKMVLLIWGNVAVSPPDTLSTVLPVPGAAQ
jgi:hypothetical protein